MKKFKTKGNYYNFKLNKVITFTFVLIIITTFFLMINFNKEINDDIINISTAEINKVTYNLINKQINHNLLNKDTLGSILNIKKNEYDTIIYVDFNLDNAYFLLDKITDVLMSNLKKMEQGHIEVAYYDKSLSNKINGLVLSIPIGSALKNNYFYNIGPKIPVKVNYVGSLITNLETKVTNYGLNNALVEMFIYIEFSNNIIANYKSKNLQFKYNVLIASMMIEGEVPELYNNGTITKESIVHSANF